MKMLLIAILFFPSGYYFSQDSLPNHAFSFDANSGASFLETPIKGQWYEPGFASSAMLKYSIRLKKDVFLSLGVGGNATTMHTSPFTRTWTTYEITSTGTYIKVQNEEAFERQVRGFFIDIRAPLQLQYMPIGTWKPYFTAGVVFDTEVHHVTRDVYAGTHFSALPYESRHIFRPNFQVSATFSGGIKYQKNNLELLCGLVGEIDPKNWRGFQFEHFFLGTEFSIRKSIFHERSPRKIRVVDDSKRDTKKNYLFVEGLGSGFLGSINYERAIYTKDKIRVRARLGFGIEDPEYFIATMPIGINWTYGRIHALELGAHLVPEFGRIAPEVYFTPHIGYRVETRKNLLLRFAITPIWFPKYNQVIGWLGVSIGGRF